MTRPTGSEFLQRYAALLGFSGSTRLIEILELLFESEAERRLAASLPGSVEELVQRSGLEDQQQVRALLQRLEDRGAIAVTPEQTTVYRPHPFIFGLRDATIVSPDASDRLVALWEGLLVEELPPLIAELKRQRLPTLVEVLPATAALPAQAPPNAAWVQLDEAEVIAALPCACRTQAHRAGRGEGCPAPHPRLCLLTDGHARAALRRDVAEAISREEALRRLTLAAEAGLVHTLSRNPRSGMFICNCCPCCCDSLRMVNALGFPESLRPSGYRAVVDVDLCDACGICAERCAFGCVSVRDSAAGEVAEVATARCYGCGSCVLGCPSGALSLVAPRLRLRR